MTTIGSTCPRSIGLTAAVCAWLAATAAGFAASDCPAERDTLLLPMDRALCASLAAAVRRPGAMPLDQYQHKLGTYLRGFCYRDADTWKVDKRVRDTGPFMATFADGKWSGTSYGTHQAVLVWYSGEMYRWLKANRSEDRPRADVAPVPDGAMIVKEMFTPPAAPCAHTPWQHLQPTEGIALMVRDRKASYDGWFWGWFGWTPWSADWPAALTNPLPRMGFGQYCLNCHASAKDNQTFAALNNIKGERGEPLVFLSQDFFLSSNRDPPANPAPVASQPRGYDPVFVAAFHAPGPAPARETVAKLPSQTYDNVWMPAAGPTPASEFVTSDQCIGCHDAHGTGLQFDMTEPGPGGKLANVSPYATWRSSPMGLSGRDPIFLAQLASETGTFHRGFAAALEDACLGCHGVGGQRQFVIDRAGKAGQCEPFRREAVDATPLETDPVSRLANYGALARDGVTCNACHHMALGGAASTRRQHEPQNRCIAQRQAFLTPGLNGFAKTFTGSFLLASPDVVYGPFEAPKQKPMKGAIGIVPEHNTNVRSSELCGSCHVVHLPVFQGNNVVGHVFEQTTYAEWAFSAYRTGTSPDGTLPQGPGVSAQTCQDCHMPSRDREGRPLVSKIAGIQEFSNFPQAEHTLPARDIDLPRRAGYAKHTLVGLNIILTEMAKQFPDVLGIRAESPMLPNGVDPIRTTEAAMLDQAKSRTAAVMVGAVKTDGATLSAAVTVVNRAGHKFPSGVGFRRAFLEFSVLDAAQRILWSSGHTNPTGVIVDDKDVPIDGELWWQPDCSARINAHARGHQPHYEVIDRQDQAQIYEELVAAPADEAAPACGAGAKPKGALTTSFLSQCAKVKDNRILPHGFLPAPERTAVAAALGAGPALAEEAGPSAVGDDPDYRSGGSDTLVYRVPLSALAGKPTSMRATLYYQPTPPYFLQDRFCTSASEDARRLYYLAGNLDLKDTATSDWKLEVATTGLVPLP